MSYSALAFAEAEEIQEFTNPDAWVRMWDLRMGIVGNVADYVSLKFGEKANAVGSMSLLLKPEDPMAVYALEAHVDEVIRITVDLPHYRWSGSVLTVRESIAKDGTQVVELEVLHDWQFLETMLIWANAFFPAWIQPLSSSRRIGPAKTVIATQLIPNLIRLQAPLWNLPTNGTLADFNTWNLIKDATHPICVKPINPLTDTSRWISSSAKFNSAADVIRDCLTNEEGIVVRIHQWLPGDEQPWKGAGFKEPRLYIDIVDNGNEKAFTGTVIDGILKTITEMVDGGLEWIMYPVIGKNGPSLGEITGLNQKKPVCFYPSALLEDSGVSESESVHHKPLASQVVVGGKSPDWLNKTVEVGIGGAFGALGGAISAATGGVQILDLSPVGEIFSSFVKDKIFAFASHEDFARAKRSGPYRWREVAKLGGNGLSLDTWQNIVTGLYETRGYSSHTIKVVNGSPYLWGRDLDMGHLVGYETLSGDAQIDRVEEFTFTDDRSTMAYLEFGIGSGLDEQSPGEKSLRKIRGVVSVLNEMATTP